MSCEKISQNSSRLRGRGAGHVALCLLRHTHKDWGLDSQTAILGGQPFGDSNLSRGDTIRTCDLYVPNVALYQLSHTP